MHIMGILYNPTDQTIVEKSNCTLNKIIIIKVKRDIRSPRDAFHNDLLT